MMGVSQAWPPHYAVSCHNVEFFQDSSEGMTIFELVKNALDECTAEALKD
jgi:hypothetical protein